MKAIVLVLHGANINGIGAYGNEWIATPTLDALASQGIVFDQHHADHPGDIRSLLSGCYHLPPFDGEPTHPDGIAHLRANGVICHRVLDLIEPARTIPGTWDAEDEDDTPLPDRVAAALDDLKSIDNWLLWIETDRLIPPWTVDPVTFEAYAGDLVKVDRYAEKKAADAREQAAEDAEDITNANPFAEMVVAPKPIREKLAPVDPWPEPPEGPINADDLEVWERLHNTYAAVLTELDRELGEIVMILTKRDLDHQSIWLISSTGGYPLGEHGIIGYTGPCLHEEATHIPLLIHLPDSEHAGRRVLELSQPIDVMPTLCEWFAIPSIPGVHGVSLLPSIRGSRTRLREYAVYADDLDNEMAIGLRTSEWSFHLPLPADEDSPYLEPKLYQKPDDRWEMNDLRMQHLDWCDALEDVVDNFHTAASQPGPLPSLPLPIDEAEKAEPLPAPILEPEPMDEDPHRETGG